MLNFSTEKPQQPSWRQRLLAPRLLVYALLAAGLAWMMHRLQPNAPRTAAGPTLKPYATNPVLRDSTLQKPRKTLPLLLVVASPNHQAAPSAAYLREKFAGRCTVVLLQAGHDQEALDYFKIQGDTAAILFSPENVEFARWETGLSPEPLAEQVDAALARLPEAP